MLKEFKAFVMRGNVMDMAVGIIIGVAFGKIVTSFVTDILMPPLGLLIRNVDFSNLYIDLSGGHYSSLAQAKAAGAPTINHGVFVNTLLECAIVGFAVFVLVRWINRLKRQPAEALTPTTKPCPYCLSVISLQATRCPHCTSQLAAA